MNLALTEDGTVCIHPLWMYCDIAAVTVAPGKTAIETA